MTRHALAVRHVAFEDLGILGPVLAEHGFEVELLDAGIDRITAECLREPELVVVLGGPIGVSDTAAYPFLAAERSGLATRMQAGHPTLGVCLGAQLMASALGATVESTGRTEIGYAPLTLTAEGRHSVLAPLDGVPVLHWHGDQFAIPAGARRLAETPGVPEPGLRPRRRAARPAVPPRGRPHADRAVAHRARARARIRRDRSGRRPRGRRTPRPAARRCGSARVRRVDRHSAPGRLSERAGGRGPA